MKWRLPLRPTALIFSLQLPNYAMRVIVSVLFVFAVTTGWSQKGGWKIMQKADTLLSQGKTKRVPSLLKRASKADYGFCGNAHAQAALQMERIWAKYYAVQGDTAAALEHLLPYVYNNALASNKEVVDLAFQLLLETNGSTALRESYLEALDSLSTGTETQYAGGPFIVHFHGQDIKYYNWSLAFQGNESTPVAIRTSIEETYFSKLILALD